MCANGQCSRISPTQRNNKFMAANFNKLFRSGLKTTLVNNFTRESQFFHAIILLYQPKITLAFEKWRRKIWALILNIAKYLFDFIQGFIILCTYMYTKQTLKEENKFIQFFLDCLQKHTYF